MTSTGKAELMTADVHLRLDLLDGATPQIERMAHRYLHAPDDAKLLLEKTMSAARAVFREGGRPDIRSAADLMTMVFRIQHQQVQQLLRKQAARTSSAGAS